MREVISGRADCYFALVFQALKMKEAGKVDAHAESLGTAVDAANRERRAGTNALSLRITVIGDRPSGWVAEDAPLVAHNAQFDFSFLNYEFGCCGHPVVELVRRQSTFDEVVHGLDESTALYEARRCMSCGNCFSCDNCYGVCPDNAVIKLDQPGGRYLIDLDYCKGCGLCVAECPSGAIQMVPEEI